MIITPEEQLKIGVKQIIDEYRKIEDAVEKPCYYLAWRGDSSILEVTVGDGDFKKERYLLNYESYGFGEDSVRFWDMVNEKLRESGMRNREGNKPF